MSGDDPRFTRVKISNLALPTDASEQLLEAKLLERLGVGPEAVNSWRILRKALDARGGRPPVHIHTIGVALSPGESARGFDPWPEEPPEPARLSTPPKARPVVVGAGPAGLFAALRLCAYGLAPLLIERGKAMEGRVRDAARYWKTGVPDPDSNVQFGEGGAGAFSDGKLTSRSKDPRKDWVLRQFVAAGANPSILYDAKPHLGTSRIRALVTGMRERLLSSGAEIHYDTRVDGLIMLGGRCVGVRAGGVEFGCSPVFLATGHSARETYAFLAAHSVALSAKGFAVGLRIETDQRALDADRLGRFAGAPGMEAAEFALTRKASDGRGVYSFCMCPGGVVIPAATEADGLVINGMSGPLRSGRFANAALVVEVRPEDFGGQPMRGFAFQRELEVAAQALAGARGVPAQTVASFLGGKKGGLGRSSCPWPLVEADLTRCLPAFAAGALAECLPSMAAEIRPLAAGSLMGVETRTSSPVRIDRGGDLVAVNTPGLYPVGEGAGYAGGIVSSAVDGVRAVDAYIEAYLGKRGT